MAIAFVLVNTEAGREKEVHDHLQRLPDVIELVPLFGEHDFIVKMEGASLEQIGAAILNAVRPIPGVLATKTLTGTKF